MAMVRNGPLPPNPHTGTGTDNRIALLQHRRISGAITPGILRCARRGRQRCIPSKNDPRSWIRFNLIAHFRQASWLLQRTRMTQRVWDEVELILKRKGINDRALSTLVDAAFGYRIRRSHYMNAAEVSEQVASRELKSLIEHGLLVGEGETKGRTYRASDVLTDAYLRHYERRQNVDPFLQEGLPFPSAGIAVG